jgi:serine protease
MRTLRTRGRLGGLLAALAIALLTACQVSTPTPDPDPDPDPTPTTGRIAGTLSVGSSGAGFAMPSADVAPAFPRTRQPDVRAGEVIVRFRDDALATAAAATTLSVDGVRLDAVRPLALPGARLFRASGLDAAATEALARRLAARPDVAYAQPNYVLHPLQTVPNDPLYDLQWHYPAIHLPAAWDVTTGSSAIVVAVVDTGILHDAGDPSRTHPDLSGRVLAGYDFVSDPGTAGDGDGRDPDPYDVDDAVDGAGYHGTHVAGTIGAATNDGYGGAGVDWHARLLPVRALGIGGGTLADIVDGTLWAAGFAVAGVPANADPAHVINLSLGGPIPCGPLEQEAFDLIASSSVHDAVVVVAAGNENVDAWGSTPASCGNVITVGATDALGARAPYSNFGTRIDVMAPGGDVEAFETDDAYPDGVLSAVRTTGPSATFTHAFFQGTSMAAPHVAGVVALMKALDPDLTPSEARGLLVLTAAPLTVGACGTGTAGDCGAGLIHAGDALSALVGDVPPPLGGELAFAPDPLELGSEATQAPVALRNTGGATATWSYLGFLATQGSIAPSAVTVAPASGSLAAGDAETVVVALDRGEVPADGAYQLALRFDVDGVEQRLTVRFRVGTPDTGTATGPTIVGAFVEVGSELVLGGNQQAQTFFEAFDFTVLAGDQLVVAWTDQNGNLELDEGDFLGTYPYWVPVPGGTRVAGIRVVLEPVIEVDRTLAAASANAGVAPSALRIAVERLAAHATEGATGE